MQLLALFGAVSVFNRANLHGVGNTLPPDPTPALPLPGHYGEEGQLQFSSMWVSHTWLNLQNMTVIQAHSSCRNRCILKVYFFLIYHFPLKVQDTSSSQHNSTKCQTFTLKALKNLKIWKFENGSVPENTILPV